MIRKKKRPQTLWLLLVVPVAGVAGWFISRIIGNRNTEHQDSVPTEGEKPTRSSPLDVTRAPTGEGNEAPAGHAVKTRRAIPSLFYVLLVPFLILATAIIVLSLQQIPVQSQSIVPDGNPERGQALLQSTGCGSCHTIPGVPGANAKVGPALVGLSDRSFIAGHLQNTPDNMILWIMHPQQVSPGVDMPDTGVTADVARDMAAYLYSIR